MRAIAQGKPYRRPSVEIVRYVVEAKSRIHHLPPLLAASRFLAATRGTGTETLIRDMLAVFGGGRGCYPFGVPEAVGVKRLSRRLQPFGWMIKAVSGGDSDRQPKRESLLPPFCLFF